MTATPGGTPTPQMGPPIPSAVWLFTGALGVLGMLSRRKKHQSHLAWSKYRLRNLCGLKALGRFPGGFFIDLHSNENGNVLERQCFTVVLVPRPGRHAPEMGTLSRAHRFIHIA